jgi:hypothetical protein
VLRAPIFRSPLVRFIGSAGNGFLRTVCLIVLNRLLSCCAASNFPNIVGKPLSGLGLAVIPWIENPIISSKVLARKVTRHLKGGIAVGIN